MTRTLSSIVLVALLTGFFSTETNAASDPIADLTKQIISRFMPSFGAAEAKEAKATTVQIDSSEAKETLEKDDMELPALETPGALERGPMGLPMMLPEMKPRTVPMPWFRPSLPSLQGMARSTTADNPAVPRPLSLSTASSNGIHAIQALVPTDDGPERVELKGTPADVQEQLKSLSPEVRRIMSQSLGLQN